MRKFLNMMGFITLMPSAVTINAQGILCCGGDCEDDEKEDCCGNQECGCDESDSKE